MKINDFYSEVLGANLKNPRWSWGAVDPISNRVYLRVWSNQISQGPDGQEVQVDWIPRVSESNGYNERSEHLRRIRDGAQGIGIVCVPKLVPHSHARQIASFDSNRLLLLGRLRDVENGTFAHIDGNVSVADVASWPTGNSTVTQDLKGLITRPLSDITVKQALIDARVGQGKFRADVLRMWGGACCVSGVGNNFVVRASHIKPWKDSSNQERLDPHNGLPLTATLDALFDAGLITFSDSGAGRISPLLTASDQKALGITSIQMRIPPSELMKVYLAFHRENRYRGN